MKKIKLKGKNENNQKENHNILQNNIIELDSDNNSIIYLSK
jgi:hypothetical protein